MSPREKGAVSIVLLSGCLLLSLGAVAGADLGSVLIARARAQSAADAAALAAAARLAPILRQGNDPERAARETAEANGARLVACDCVPGQPAARVLVTTRARATLVRAWHDLTVRASAVARVDDDVFTYRE